MLAIIKVNASSYIYYSLSKFKLISSLFFKLDKLDRFREKQKSFYSNKIV
jgi:hypothetical protein